MNEIYFDNSATTKPSEAVINKIKEVLLFSYGNPSSLHAKGFEAEKVIATAKEQIANVLGARPDELYFTSGGTEANNLAILGAAAAKKRLGNRIVTTAIEHDSVLGPCAELEKQGFEVLRLKPDSFGNINKQQLVNAINSKTILVSMMMVNNEVGSHLPIECVKDIITAQKAPALFHTDAVQAFGKVPVDVYSIGADLITISSHKMHGPKGIGALYCSKNARIIPILFGGGQQKSIRPGTMAPALIAGFGTAAQESTSEDGLISELYSRCKTSLLKMDRVKINEVIRPFYYIINVSILGIKSETMLHYLSEKRIFVSSGSACSGGKSSHVLKAMGLPQSTIDSAIRISFCKYNTVEEVEYLVSAIKDGMASLARG